MGKCSKLLTKETEHAARIQQAVEEGLKGTLHVEHSKDQLPASKAGLPISIFNKGS